MNDELEKAKVYFNKKVDRTNNLLKDSYYYKQMVDYVETKEEKERFKNISDILYKIFIEENEKIDRLFKEH